MRNRRCWAMDEVVAEAFSQIDKEKHGHPEPGAAFFFRGESRNYQNPNDPSAELETGWLCGLDRKAWRIEHERDLYHAAMRYNIVSFSRDRTMVERLIRMQHYRLPTRFADLTTNISLAAFFAADGENLTKGDISLSDGDGYIRVIKVAAHKMKMYTSDIITAIAHLPLVKQRDVNPSRMNGLEVLRYEVTNERPGFSMYIRPDGGSEKMRDLERLLRKEIQQVWAFRGVYNNDRVRNQSGVFLAFGCGDEKARLKATFSPKDYEVGSSPTYGIKQIGYVQIHRDAKRRILEQLGLMGMEAPVVYPDLSDVCKSITNEFELKLDERKGN